MTHKASEGPKIVRDKHNIQSFCNAVMAADGSWIEMPQGDISTTSLRNAVLIHIGGVVAEVSVRNGVVYARMRKST